MRDSPSVSLNDFSRPLTHMFILAASLGWAMSDFRKHEELAETMRSWGARAALTNRH